MGKTRDRRTKALSVCTEEFISDGREMILLDANENPLTMA